MRRPTERVSALETRLFRAVNDLPDTLLPFVWLPMQSGSLAAVPIAGLAMGSLARQLILRDSAGHRA